MIGQFSRDGIGCKARDCQQSLVGSSISFNPSTVCQIKLVLSYWRRRGSRFLSIRLNNRKAGAVYGNRGPGKRGYIVADTLLLMIFLRLRKLGNICCGHKMFLNKIRKIFFVSRMQNLCPLQMLRGETVVSATMCPRLPGPKEVNSLAMG